MELRESGKSGIGGVSIDHGVEGGKKDEGKTKQTRNEGSREKKKFGDKKSKAEKKQQGVFIAGETCNVVAEKKKKGTNSTEHPKETETGSLELEISEKKSGTEEQG